MTKLEAIVQPNRFDAVKSALVDIGIDGMTVSEVRGHGRQKGHTETYHGHEYSVDLLPKIKIEIVTDDQLVDQIVDAIIKNAATGKIGDGKIFVSKIEEAIRIRNQERGAAALSGAPAAGETSLCAPSCDTSLRSTIRLFAMAILRYRFSAISSFTNDRTPGK